MARYGCWNCGNGLDGEHFCRSCGKLQPHRKEVDYFLFFGLSRNLKVDAVDLEERFYALSRKLHPDNFYRALETERAASLEKSAVLNDAYRTLKEPLARAHYLVELEGEKVEGNNKNVPPELLEEVFELNEWLAELKTAGKESQTDDSHIQELRSQLEQAQANFKNRMEELYKDLGEQSVRWDQIIESGTLEGERRSVLRRLVELLSKSNYLRNLLLEVGGVLSQSSAGTKSRRNDEQAIPNLAVKLASH